jgi:phosphatidylserine/phosphatidylglycerophosphate/cardiolipin synthase-like enzyme
LILALGLFLVVLALQAIEPGASEPIRYTPPPNATPLLHETAVPETSPLRVFFTAPLSPSARLLQGGPDEALAESILEARVSVDVAAYQFNLVRLRQALVEAHRRGVAVRMVTDSDYLDEPEVQKIIEEGIPVLGDRREGLMHNKFVVIDRTEVWTGSMNLTDNGAYRNNNHLLCIRSAELAASYHTEFEEMFSEDKFGSGSPSGGPSPQINISGLPDGLPVEVYFSPEDGTARRIIELVGEAQESISVLAYSFTSDEIAGALLNRHQAGVNISGVFETSQYLSNTGTEYERLLEAGMDVHLDGNSGNMHHKVIILDGEIVITGSYNFSASAETRNDENTLIIRDADTAGLFMEEFQKIYRQALDG